MKINAILFTKTFDREGVGSVASTHSRQVGQLAVSSHLWGGCLAVAPHLLQCLLVKASSIMETNVLCLQEREGEGRRASKVPTD